MIKLLKCKANLEMGYLLNLPSTGNVEVIAECDTFDESHTTVTCMVERKMKSGDHVRGVVHDRNCITALTEDRFHSHLVFNLTWKLSENELGKIICILALLPVDG